MAGVEREMATTGDIDIMEHVFGKISLPDVQARSRGASRRNTELDESAPVPVPKQRQEVLQRVVHEPEEPLVLRRGSEFRASSFAVTETREVLGDEVGELYPDNRVEALHYDAHAEELLSDNRVEALHYEAHAEELHSDNRVEELHYDAHGEELRSEASEECPSVHSAQRRESTISRKSEPIYDSVHSDHEYEAPVEPPAIGSQGFKQPVELDSVSVSSKLPKRSSNNDQLIAELRTRHEKNADYDTATITTSKTSEIANEYELYTTPTPASESTEMNEQTDDSGTETEEVLPVNRTKYLFDSKDPYHVEHNKEHTDSFQQELGQRIASYQREAPAELQELHTANTLKSPESEHSAASEFIVSIFENNTQDRVRSEVGSEIKIHDLRQMFESPPPAQNEHHENNVDVVAKPSYKHFVGRKSPEPRILRSGSIMSTITFVQQEPPSELRPHEQENNYIAPANSKVAQQFVRKSRSASIQKPAQKPFVGKLEPILSRRSSNATNKSQVLREKSVNGDQSRRSSRHDSVVNGIGSTVPDPPICLFAEHLALAGEQNGIQSHRNSIVVSTETAGHTEAHDNGEHTPVSRLCTIFEENHQMPQKTKRFVSAPVSPVQTTIEGNGVVDREQVHVPLLTRVVISDATAQGKGNCSPGSIAALHKSILEGNPIIRHSMPIIDIEATSEADAKAHSGEVQKKGRKPKTLAAFYTRWGKMPTIVSEI